jgi:hypothetical protein
MYQNWKERWPRAEMVGWYNPFQLSKTAIQVATSALLGTRADYRVIEALTTEQGIFNCGERSEIWIDYVADLGDGWNPTYAIATLLARSNLEVPSHEQARKCYLTKRGDILIMGGDEVYPTASREEYQARLVRPYECALERTQKPHPLLFALPGNHDWYDGLASFTRLFCQERWFAGWCTKQKRSYFALKLPARWWLWGVDIQLESDIDLPQLEYFRQIAKEEMNEGDGVIFCTAKPDWIYGNIYEKKLENTLAYLEKKVIEQAGAKVMVTLAGDLHHYRRHESIGEPKIQKITAGGGGAFLHPTHGPKVRRIVVGPKGKEAEFSLEAEFPAQRVSRRLTWRNLLFPILNPRFGILTGFVYMMIAWVLQSGLKTNFQNTPVAVENIWTIVLQTAVVVLRTPSASAWILGLILGFVFFTDTHSKLYRWIAGSIHGLSHLLTNLLLGWCITRITISTLSLDPSGFAQPIIAGVGLFVGGYLAGSLLMGIYLLISLNVFRRHSNEAFSSLRIQDYKNFLRLHIDTEGKLTIYPIGIKKIPKDWVPAMNPDESDPKLAPKRNKTMEAFLIEEPIEVFRSKSLVGRMFGAPESHCREDSNGQ